MSEAVSRSQGEERVLRLGEDLTVGRAVEIRERLLRALDGDGGVVLEIPPEAEPDVSFLQLVCAAHRTAAARGRRLRLGSVCPPKLVELSALAGFQRHHGCTADCLWVEVRNRAAAP